MRKIVTLLMLTALVPFLLGVHECTGEDCLFCAQLSLLRAAFVWTAGLVLPTIVCRNRLSEKDRRDSVSVTPVLLRVRLLD